MEVVVDGSENKVKVIGLWKIWNKKMQSVKVEDGRKHVVQKELKKRKLFWEIEMEN